MQEIAKLGDLKAKGLLTEEEFQKMKANLIAALIAAYRCLSAAYCHDCFYHMGQGCTCFSVAFLCFEQ
jgi:hypothetical protein